MALVRWEPIREINSIQNEVNRLFDSFFDAPARGERAPRRWIPAMDLVETGDHYVLRADLPGVHEEDLKIELDDRTLTLSGERKSAVETERGGYHRIERSYGAFSRSLTLPEGVDADAISASFDRGVLEVRVPKPVASQPRRISIATGAQPAIEGKETTGGQSAAGDAA
ncbi:Hsp20/alpha crystallin family protein [Conexibacter arvalis]|uniref:HSP20 family protein n=1 Tax=Conexibacter arvalis TaxID=912552 RepID=A0A840IKF8_9ACTN|nr:Hsp20/alpha crystallin family protein [Conexibacter arvalis]MBB4664504.1 HSP20 family protein [Conexibacter arvalis]